MISCKNKNKPTYARHVKYLLDLQRLCGHSIINYFSEQVVQERDFFLFLTISQKNNLHTLISDSNLQNLDDRMRTVTNLPSH